MFQDLPSPAVKEILDSVSSMSSCIVMKDDGVHCQQVSLLSPKCWIKVVMVSTKMKEPLRGTRYNSSEEIICAVGLSKLDINRN
jgi:hypothetical protein